MFRDLPFSEAIAEQILFQRQVHRVLKKIVKSVSGCVRGHLRGHADQVSLQVFNSRAPLTVLACGTALFRTSPVVSSCTGFSLLQFHTNSFSKAAFSSKNEAIIMRIFVAICEYIRKTGQEDIIKEKITYDQALKTDHFAFLASFIIEVFLKINC
jgi:hypothetical protein